jgi:hypothetical protein
MGVIAHRAMMAQRASSYRQAFRREAIVAAAASCPTDRHTVEPAALIPVKKRGPEGAKENSGNA